jgi:hypothetical protein
MEERTPPPGASLEGVGQGRRQRVIIINKLKKKIIYYGLVQPLAKRLPGLGYFRPSKPCRWRGKRLHHGGDVCEPVFS